VGDEKDLERLEGSREGAEKKILIDAARWKGQIKNTLWGKVRLNRDAGGIVGRTYPHRTRE